MGTSFKKAMLLGSLVILLSGGFSAQDLQNAPDRSTGLIPLDKEREEAIAKNWPHISHIGLNRIGLGRINRVRAKKGKPPLASSIAEPVGREIDGTIGVADVALASPVTSGDIVGDLPVSVDNSLLEYFPPIRNQGSLGSCAPFAITYYQLSYMRAFQQGMNIRDNADNTNKFSPKWSYNMLNGGTNKGSYLDDNFKLLEYHGACTWAEFPYDNNYLSWCLDGTAWRNALSVRTNPAQFTDSNHDQIKQILNNGYVLTFATFVYSWQFKTIQDDLSTTEDDAEIGKAVGFWVNGTAGSHMMTIVGYNDAIWTDVNSNGAIDVGEKGAFRVANSWGPYWQDGGFTWLAYDAIRSPSGVPGGPNSSRYMGFQGNKAYVITTRQDYSPMMLAEFTISHAKRNQIRMKLGLSEISQTSPATQWTPIALDFRGGSYAFDGSATAVDGTFVLDFTDIMTFSGVTRRFYLLTYDPVPGDPATLKALKFIDTTTDPDTEILCPLVPQYVDNQEVYSYVDHAYSGPVSNHLPLIPEMPGFYPSAGTLSDVFNFWVYYYDQDGDAPTVKNIYVDGVDHPLTLWSGTPSSGYYHYETSLPLGTHDYRFYFEDGRGGTARSPIVATLPGPVVVLDHIVSQPSAPTGEAAPSPGVSRSYTTATSICNLGHAVQYRFDWGDGGTSDWLPVGQTSEAHAWAAAGAYLVRAQARCSVVPAVISSWTEALSVNVAGTLRKTDLNGDGQEDILWRYCGMGGYIRTWFMSNTDGAASAITPSDGEMTPESGHQEPNHRMSGEALFPSFMSGKGKSGPINKGERSRPADIMCASAKRTRGAGSVDDPRKAGTGLQMPIFGVCSDPRQVSSPPHQGLTPSLSSERVASPQLLGGADVMPVGDLNWEIVGSGDFNNDSRTDILWRNISNGANVVWFMNGTEWSGSAELLPVGDQSWEIVGTGDFNRDGNVDILWRNSVSGDNVVWYMNGTTWIGSAILLKVTDQSWHIVGTGDFDKDGNIDILWRYNGAGGYNVVWHLDNATWIASSELIPVGDTNWQIVGTGDYNNDGNIDILWRYNGPGGYNGIWYMNGMTWIGSAELLPVPDLSWKIVNR